MNGMAEIDSGGIYGVNVSKVEKGSATISANTNSVTVAHSLGSALIKIILTPTNDFASQGAKAINYTATTFDIAFAFGATQPSNATFDWEGIL